MEKMNMKIGLLALLSVLLVTAISGCISMPGGETTAPPEEGGVGGLINPYDTAVEILPVGAAEQHHNLCKPIFTSVFGGAKLTTSGTAGGAVVLEYIVKRPVSQNDMNALTAGFEGRGYRSVLALVEEDTYLLEFAKGEGDMVAIEGEFGEQEIGTSGVVGG